MTDECIKGVGAKPEQQLAANLAMAMHKHRLSTNQFTVSCLNTHISNVGGCMTISLLTLIALIHRAFLTQRHTILY